MTGIATDDVVFTGTFDEVDAYFREREWSDGHSFAPPTIEKVEAFLEYTDLPRDHQIALLRPSNIAATPLNIAANGVMAGCRPEHMPLLVAAVEALADKSFNLVQLGTTAGRHPFLVINGPIIDELGIEYQTSAISRGPNPALGRALGLIVRNIAGFKPGGQYLGTYGYFLPFVLAENERELQRIGWAPLNVEDGFSPGSSTVSLGNTHNYGAQGRETSGTDVEGILMLIAREVVREVNTMLSMAWANEQMTTVLMTPCQAEQIAAAGYSRKDVENFLYENSLVAIDDIQFDLKHGDGGGKSTDVRTVIESGLSKAPREWVDLPGDARVPVMVEPGQIRVVVTGNPTRSNVMVLYSCYTPAFSTREITLPARWAELRDRQ